jgi:hypothetical protein
MISTIPTVGIPNLSKVLQYPILFAYFVSVQEIKQLEIPRRSFFVINPFINFFDKARSESASVNTTAS